MRFASGMLAGCAIVNFIYLWRERRTWGFDWVALIKVVVPLALLSIVLQVASYFAGE